MGMTEEYIDISVQELHGAFSFLMNCTVTEAGMTLDECAEKQIPKKPYILPINKEEHFDYCPNCKTDGHLVASSSNYCDKCGQRLDWGNEDAESSFSN